MLENAGQVIRDYQDIREHGAASGKTELCDVLFDRLRQLGFEPLTRYCGNVVGAAGIPYRLPVMRVLRSPSESVRLLQALCDLLRQDTPLTLALTDLGSEDIALHSLQAFCESLRSGLSRNGLSAEGIGLCLHSHQVPLQAYSVIANSVPRTRST